MGDTAAEAVLAPAVLLQRALRQVSRVAVGMLFLSASSKACCRLKESGRAAKRASWGVGVRERGTSSDGSRVSMPAE